jgi:hypothetical protein
MRASVRLTVFLNENGYGLTEQKIVKIGFW